MAKSERPSSPGLRGGDTRRYQPWHPPPYRIEDLRALQAIARYAQSSEAAPAEPPSPQDCKRALDWIVEVAAATYDEPFRPGEPDVRDYLLGRRSVGLAIVKLLKLKPEMLLHG